jgi:DNA-directed RNA polymerase specialized sigma24 family protein
LPYRQRAAVVLRFWADWSHADIADALRCRESSARVLVHRGLAALRSQLVEEEQRP